MKLIVSPKVRHEILAFYAEALKRYPTLDESVIRKKVDRLFDSLGALTQYPGAYASARVRPDWKSAGYREYLCEDFHFAYEICLDIDGEECILVVDAVHSLLNHE